MGKYISGGRGAGNTRDSCFLFNLCTITKYTICVPEKLQETQDQIKNYKGEDGLRNTTENNVRKHIISHTKNIIAYHTLLYYNIIF